jgi:glutathione peroxidase
MTRLDPHRRLCIRLAPAAIASLVLTDLSYAGNGNVATTNSTGNNACKSLLSHRIRPLMQPEPRLLCDHFSSQVLLIVNTASKCGFTPQFADLEKLHNRFSEQGFQVLGFPSADFRQELNAEEKIAEFCELNYGVSFPMFEKISVTGNSAHPLYQQLAQATGTYPRWNFNKYLVNRQADVISHYDSGVQPLDSRLVGAIENLL